MSDRIFHTLVDALLAAPPDNPFITMWRDEDDMETVTFGDFTRLARLHAANFHEQGLRSGETVILILPQGIELMAAFAGAMLLGSIPAILAYPNFKADPIKYSSGLSGVSQNLNARLLVVDEAFPDALAARLVMGPNGRLVRNSAGAPAPSEVSFPTPARLDSSCAFIQHSAGTTGLQKGVALSHRSVLTQLKHLTSALEINDQDRIYSWLPLYHDMGLIACFMLPLAYHLPVIVQSPIDWVLRPGTMLQLISEHRCTLAWIPNFALQFLARRVRAADCSDYDLSCLRALINCSEPVRARSIDEFQSAYASLGLQPSAMKSSYAMAENVFAVTQSDAQTAARRLWVSADDLWQRHVAQPVPDNSEGSLCFVSSGRCLPGNRVRIVSPEAAELADGHVGEILIQSDSLFGGYTNRPDLTAKALQGGWYRSGDLGFLWQDDLYIIGRKNDLIIVAGKNVYPQDIEEIASSHPAIHDGRAVAFGLYNPELGTEEIILVAEAEHAEALKDAAEIERAIRNAIVAELDVTPRAIYLKPLKWIVKSTAGKPARSSTREKLLMEHPELIGRGHEFLFELVTESVMTRSVEGRINFWNRRAEELYGWTKDEALGQISHDLLQTQFPEPLEHIDSELVQKGRWEGELVHRTRTGERVVVKSRWILNSKQESGAVVEINTQPTEGKR